MNIIKVVLDIYIKTVLERVPLGNYSISQEVFLSLGIWLLLYEPRKGQGGSPHFRVVKQFFTQNCYQSVSFYPYHRNPWAMILLYCKK